VSNELELALIQLAKHIRQRVKPQLEKLLVVRGNRISNVKYSTVLFDDSSR
jgi:hypothetical protein